MLGWISWFGTGAITLVVSWLLSVGLAGCRWGNRVEQSQISPSDPWTGFYEMQLQTLTFCASAANFKCLPAPASQLPSTLSRTLTNPVGFLVVDRASGRSAFINPADTSTSIQTYIDPSGKLSYLGFAPPEVAFNDPACTITLQLEEKGQLTKAGPFVTGTNLTLKGRIAFDVQVVKILDGNCNATRQEMYECYQGVTDTNGNLKCGANTVTSNQSNRDYVRGLVDPFIAAGTMTAEDIKTLTKIGYQAIYE